MVGKKKISVQWWSVKLSALLPVPPLLSVEDFNLKHHNVLFVFTLVTIWLSEREARGTETRQAGWHSGFHLGI